MDIPENPTGGSNLAYLLYDQATGRVYRDSTGPAGPTGAQGVQGTPGPEGRMGPTGPPAESSFVALRNFGSSESVTFEGDTPKLLNFPQHHLNVKNFTFDEANGAFIVQKPGVYLVQFRFATQTDYSVLTPDFGQQPGQLTVYINNKPSDLTHPLSSQYGNYTCECFGALEFNQDDIVDVRYTGILTPNPTVYVSEWVFIMRSI